MKTIRTDLDTLYLQRAAVVKSLELIDAELLYLCGQMKEDEMVSQFQYVKPGKTFDRSVAAIMAMSKHIEIPTKVEQDWGKFQKQLKALPTFKGLCIEYQLYKERKAYLKGPKKVA